MIGRAFFCGAICALATAQPAAAEITPAKSCVGSYRLDLTFVGPNAMRPYMATLAADGTVIASPPGASATFQPGGADVEYSSPGHGVWREIEPGRCRVVVEGIDAYPDGRISGVSRAVIDFAVDAKGVTLEGTATAMAPNGETTGTLRVEGTGRRITIDY